MDKSDLLGSEGIGNYLSDLGKIISLIKRSEIKGNNIISKIDDNTQVIFRKDYGILRYEKMILFK